MQTRYNLLYRYMNENTNTPVTNESEYEKTEEFYTKEHKFNITDVQLQDAPLKDYDLKYVFEANQNGTSVSTAALEYANTMKNEADTEREVLITENMANLEKSNLLYVYNGTKRVYHKRFIPEQLGYRVRDWKKVPSDQIPSGPDDFSKHFVMLGGYQLGVDGAYLLCKPQYIKNYMKYKDGSTKCFLCLSTTDLNNTGYRKNSQFYNKHTYLSGEFDLKTIIDDEVFFEWYNSNEISSVDFNEVAAPTIKDSGLKKVVTQNPNDPGVEMLITRNRQSPNYSGLTTIVNQYYYFFWNNSEGNYVVPGTNVLQTGNLPSSTTSIHTYPNRKQYETGSVNYTNYYDGWDAQDLNANGYLTFGTKITITANNIIREVIPEHYEETGTNPYFIKDTYKKIPFSPWMMHSAHNSLESALAMARKLVSMVGINNVKLIKYVPIDQHIKIK